MSSIKIDWKVLLIGMALLALPILYFFYTGVSLRPLDPHEHLVQNGLAYIFLLLFSYFNYTIFVPRWYLNRRYSKYIILTTLCILGAIYLPYRIEQWVFFKPPKEHSAKAWIAQIFWAEMMLGPETDRLGPPDERDRLFDIPPDLREPQGFRHFEKPPRTSPEGKSMSLILPAKLAIFFLLGSVSSLISILIQATNRLRRVEKDQLQAELRQLKAQIQPHFLFNTLNSIYSLAIRKDDSTADTIVKLSEFLRYVISDAHRDQVYLTTEVTYIENYIGLQKARLRDAVQVNYIMEGQMNGVLIAPLILFSFVENAFKYGVNPEEESTIDIHLTFQDQLLRLFVSNKKVQVSRLEASTGIGLTNTRERLRLIYPDRHELKIDDEQDSFSVTLHLTLA